MLTLFHEEKMMSIECKVCSSDYKEVIEKMILSGESNNAIAESMQEKGFMITHASVNRHKMKHMPEFKDEIEKLKIPKHNTKYERNEDMCIDVGKIFDEITRDIVKECKSVENYDVMYALLFRIFNNQLAILVDLQEKYIAGLGKYPYEQIKGLQVLQDLIKDFNGFVTSLHHRKNNPLYREN